MPFARVGHRAELQPRSVHTNLGTACVQALRELHAQHPTGLSSTEGALFTGTAASLPPTLLEVTPDDEGTFAELR